MTSRATTCEAYLKALPAERREVMSQLRQTIVNNLPMGFEETMSYGMIGYVVPHDTYPPGYHCDPKLPLPFIHIARKKISTPSTTAVSTPSLNSCNGSRTLTPDTPAPS